MISAFSSWPPVLPQEAGPRTCVWYELNPHFGHHGPLLESFPRLYHGFGFADN